ncbi:PREDICTED: uncharacterized protein LOC107880980 [Prunus mume]|uniref:Uncharacterized protein LOC107880980 n=1 Tax=Prunus mume TaxID=102107 RepID=A0ABM1LP90_PRUMU|nr:PREDICTED: uncharacterized protein LOC107880980 [Prunus mume]
MGTPNIAASTSSQFPAVLPPTSHCLGTPDIVADTSPQFPVVLHPTPPFLSISDTTAGTSPKLPTVLPPTPHFLSTSDTTAGTYPLLPTMPPRGEIIDDSHKDGDVSTSVGHLSEKSMSWQDWDNSFMTFKAFFHDGVTHSMKSSHGSVFL